jgi:adenylate cyclase
VGCPSASRSRAALIDERENYDDVRGKETRRGSGAELAQEVWRREKRIVIVSNVLGAALVLVFGALVFPTTLDRHEAASLAWRGAVAAVVYVALALPLGTVRGRRTFSPIRCWLEAERPSTEPERQAALRRPAVFASTAASYWAIGAVLFSLIALSVGGLGAAAIVAVMVALGAMMTCAVGYLLFERAGRPLSARALADGKAAGASAPGVSARLTVAWTFATGVPLLGATALAVAELVGGEFNERGVIVAMLFLVALAMCVGLGAIVVASRSVADRVLTLRDALERIKGGDFEARVAVDDASEVGRLQAGFNRMAEGLAERERIRKPSAYTSTGR